MKTLMLQTGQVEETEALGERLGALLRPGDFVGLSGELGAGKTAFVRGVACGVGVPREAQVSSPTFALVNTYRGGRLPLLHADLYRVSDAEELYDAGFYDLVGGEGAFVVEWIDRVVEVAPPEWLEVALSHQNEGRALRFVAHGPRWEAVLAQLSTGSE